MVRSANVPDDTAPTVSAGGGGGTPMGVQASPNAFGAQVGGAIEGFGKEAGDLAAKYTGIVNETAMTNADADFATKVGDIKAKYTSLTGMAAFNAFPQYQNDVRAAFNDARGSLPGGAQRGFDIMASRTMANHIADGSGYAAGQLKEAQRDSYTNLANAQFKSLLDPSIAADNDRSQYHLDSLKYAAQAQVDENHPGLTTDPKTGAVSVDSSTPDGQNLKSQIQQRQDTYLTQGYTNRFSTLMKSDVQGAYAEYQKERGSMPRGAQVSLDAMFAPKVFDMHTQGATGSALQDAAQGHWQALTNPPAVNARDSISKQEWSGQGQAPTSVDGAVGNHQILPETFARYAKPGEVITNPKDNDVVYNRIMDDYQQRYPNDPARQAVAYFSGTGNVTPAGSPTPYIRDSQDGNGKHVSSYVDDVTKRLDGAPIVAKSYGTNENGAPLSTADYYALHRQDILAKGDAYSEQMMPGDLALKRATRQSLNNYMESAIQNQHVQYTMDNRNVMKAISGAMTQGKPPSTEPELRAIPGVSALLDKVAYQDPKFSETIPTLISRMSRQNVTTNSPNAYPTALRSLEPNDGAHPNGIFSQDHLDRLLGRTDGTGINKKDYNDITEGIELPDKWKAFLSKNMQTIAGANGNIDGKGQQRALAFYNSANELYKAKTTKGALVVDLVNPESKDHIGISGNFMPSRAEQIRNIAQNVGNGTQAQMQVFDSPDDPGFSKLPSGAQFKTSDGQLRTKR